MGIEIERKFLVTGDGWRLLGKPVYYRQGYLNRDPLRSVRVRIEGDNARLNIKSRRGSLKRIEYEYPIPLEDACFLLDEVCEQPIIMKYRTTFEFRGIRWEVDEFLGENEGMTVAEVELEEEHQPLQLPDWVGKEVSDDPRFLNINLIRYPFRNWAKR